MSTISSPATGRSSQALARSHSHWYRYGIKFNSFSTFLFRCVVEQWKVNKSKTDRRCHSISIRWWIKHERMIIVAILSLFLFGDNVILILRFVALSSDSTNWFIRSVILRKFAAWLFFFAEATSTRCGAQLSPRNVMCWRIFCVLSFHYRERVSRDITFVIQFSWVASLIFPPFGCRTASAHAVCVAN